MLQNLYINYSLEAIIRIIITLIFGFIIIRISDKSLKIAFDRFIKQAPHPHRKARLVAFRLIIISDSYFNSSIRYGF